MPPNHAGPRAFARLTLMPADATGERHTAASRLPPPIAEPFQGIESMNNEPETTDMSQPPSLPLTGSSGTVEAGSAIDKAAVERVLAHIRTEQSLARALVGVLVGAAVGAGIWGGITVATGYQIGFMALGVGFLVGALVRRFGKGIDPIFGFVGGAFAILGCLTGNLLSGCGFLAAEQGISFGTVVADLDPNMAWFILQAMFDPIDVLFYGIAIYEGYRFSFRQVTQEEILFLAGETAAGAPPLQSAA